MFPFFSSPQKRARALAEASLERAQLVWNFRKDLWSPADQAEFLRARAAVAALGTSGAAPPEWEAALAALEAVLRRLGGTLYPRSALAENIEFLVVAAVVILGLRSYFLQPMVIPTNSMWPTYYGMTAENFPPRGPAPGWLARAARFVAYGAVREEVDAPVSGEVAALFVIDTTGQPRLISTKVVGRSWLVFPSPQAEYTLFVDQVPVRVRLPEDFDDFERVVLETYFPPGTSLAAQWERALQAGRVRRALATGTGGQRYYVYQVPLGRTVAAGEPVVRFDRMRGDMLLVDRVSYHFVRPRVGSAFVFLTSGIPDLVASGEGGQYFIKRLAGVPGDTLAIKPPVLYRNGQPITGASAFSLNAERVEGYRGYFNGPPSDGHYLLPGESVTVPAHDYFALGDNSGNSADSRYWGFVPDQAVIGRPLFHYYPFTRRWGLTH